MAITPISASYTPSITTAITRACGCEGVRVERSCDFRPALELALVSSAMTVLDVMIDPKAYPPITLHEGKLN